MTKNPVLAREMALSCPRRLEEQSLQEGQWTPLCRGVTTCKEQKRKMRQRRSGGVSKLPTALIPNKMGSCGGGHEEQKWQRRCDWTRFPLT